MRETLVSLSEKGQTPVSLSAGARSSRSHKPFPTTPPTWVKGRHPIHARGWLSSLPPESRTFAQAFEDDLIHQLRRGQNVLDVDLLLPPLIQLKAKPLIVHPLHVQLVLLLFE